MDDACLKSLQPNFMKSRLGMQVWPYTACMAYGYAESQVILVGLRT